MKILEIFFIKIRNIRNLYFLIFLIVFIVAVLLLYNYYDSGNNLTMMNAFVFKIFSLYLIISISSENNSGLTSKLISNGRSRKTIFYDHLVKLLILCVFGSLVMVVLNLLIALLNPQIQLSNLILFIPALLNVLVISLFIAIFVKKQIFAVLVGYFAPQVDQLIHKILLNHSDPVYSILLPYSNAESLILAEFPIEYGTRLLSSIVFSALFLRLTYRKILGGNYIN